MTENNVSNSEVIFMHIGQQLKKYVEGNYPNKSEFARIIGSSPQLLNSYFGRENLKYSTVKKIGACIGKEQAELMAILEQQ